MLVVAGVASATRSSRTGGGPSVPALEAIHCSTGTAAASAQRWCAGYPLCCGWPRPSVTTRMEGDRSAFVTIVLTRALGTYTLPPSCRTLGGLLNKGLGPREWNNLLRAIERHACTPVVGAGASHGVVRLASEIAKDWAAKYHYPIVDSENLARVAQYMAITEYADFPKEHMVDELRQNTDPNLQNTPYPILAELPFLTYITTNYDDLLVRALRPNKDPQVDYCRWNNFDELDTDQPSLGTDYKPSIAQPLVYHLHGSITWPKSLVLTEEDYLDFLIASAETSRERSAFLRHDIRAALAGNALLFIGYRLSDWTFRVLYRGLMRSITANFGKPSVSIQLVDDALEDREEEAQSYLKEYFGKLHGGVEINVYWGHADDFAQELLERWHDWNDRASGVA